MSYQEKRSVTGVIVGVLVIASYSIYSFSGLAKFQGPREWAVTILVFIGAGIVAMILAQILMHVAFSVSIAARRAKAGENCDDAEIGRELRNEMREDERDRVVELKSLKIGYYLSGAGIIAGLVTLALNQGLALFINLVFLSAALGSIVEGLAQILLYRRGGLRG
jgi:hypothetical protein